MGKERAWGAVSAGKVLVRDNGPVEVSKEESGLLQVQCKCQLQQGGVELRTLELLTMIRERGIH